ncbi:MAG: hypothetical protein ABIH27_03320 [Candidatus Omnitrophota bacterium]
MGILFDLRQKIEAEIKAKNLDKYEVRGRIMLKTGFTIAFITTDTPDDPYKITQLKEAMREVLGIQI